jgi:PAS domain S-box-containing protein
MLMKNKVMPTSMERVLQDNEMVVSRTDLKGLIVYCNSVFIKYAGYAREELMGRQHNIVRHPDMPRAVFKLLWDELAQGREVNAYVKNMSKDGGFYWVLANVTPDVDESGNVTGYFSVRRRVHPDAKAAVSALYRTMLDAERNAGSRDAIAASTKILLDAIASHGCKSYEEFIFNIIKLG